MKSHRDTIYLENAEILEHQAFEGDQYTLRVRAPEIANHATPGSFAHITCDPQRPMRRPISIMRVIPKNGEVEFLYKAFGEGTALLAQRKVGESLSILGPIGRPFELHSNRPRPLLIGGGVGMPPMVFVADMIRQQHTNFSPFMILGSEVPFPFSSQPSEFMIPGMPDGVVASMPLMEDWNIPCRLASTQGYVGCFEGYVTDLARLWLDALTADQRQEVEIFTCGPHPMLEAVASLASEYNLPCQVSLEEFMACAVGGCAGCVVEVQTDNGPAMQRVCVDGPVFDANRVFS
ncbi:MAG: dihydroorotate dehydrogenase electron transfer subunit [Halobacteria archaeon]|nr:dihydroorotate dehydrogenase electron transfer subunit [Halobacteria archaeon]